MNIKWAPERPDDSLVLFAKYWVEKLGFELKKFQFQHQERTCSNCSTLITVDDYFSYITQEWEKIFQQFKINILMNLLNFQFILKIKFMGQ